MALKYKSFGGRVLSAVPGFERKGHLLRSDTVEFDAGDLGAVIVGGVIAATGKALVETARNWVDEHVARRGIRAALEEAGVPEAMATKKAGDIKLPRQTLEYLLEQGAQAEGKGILALAAKAAALREVAENLAGAATEAARERRTAA